MGDHNTPTQGPEAENHVVAAFDETREAGSLVEPGSTSAQVVGKRSKKQVVKPTDAENAEIETFVVKIIGSWQKSVSCIVETGKVLVRAKEALPHGHFQLMIATQLPFSPRTAQMLMEIARHPIIGNAKFVSHLPPSWGALNALCALPEKELLGLMKNGSVNPEMTRNDVARLGFHLFQSVPKAVRLLLHFMGRMEPEELAQHAYAFGLWQEHELRLMEKLPDYIKHFRIEIKRMLDAGEDKTGREANRIVMSYRGDPIEETKEEADDEDEHAHEDEAT